VREIACGESNHRDAASIIVEAIPGRVSVTHFIDAFGDGSRSPRKFPSRSIETIFPDTAANISNLRRPDVSRMEIDEKSRSSSNGDRNLSLSFSRKMATSAFLRDASISIADVARKRDIYLNGSIFDQIPDSIDDRAKKPSPPTARRKSRPRCVRTNN